MIDWTRIHVRVWGFYRSRYAYWDISVTNRMHNVFVRIWEIRDLTPICKSMHMGIAVRIWGTPYAYRQGLLRICIWGVPVRIMKLCPYWDLHKHLDCPPFCIDYHRTSNHVPVSPPLPDVPIHHLRAHEKSILEELSNLERWIDAKVIAPYSRPLLSLAH